MTREGTPIRYLRAIFLGDDEVCFHLYEAGSPELVREASRRAAIPVERVTEAEDVDLTTPDPEEAADRANREGRQRIDATTNEAVGKLIAVGGRPCHRSRRRVR
jgi:hypothetical protein